MTENEKKLLIIIATLIDYVDELNNQLPDPLPHRPQDTIMEMVKDLEDNPEDFLH